MMEITDKILLYSGGRSFENSMIPVLHILATRERNTNSR